MALVQSVWGDRQHSDNVTPSKVRELHNFATVTPQRQHFVALEEDFVHCSQVARGLKPEKESSTFSEWTCRWTAVWPCDIFLGPASSVGLQRLDRSSIRQRVQMTI